MDIVIFSVILLTVLLNTIAQLLMKVGMVKIGTFSFSLSNLVPIGLKIIASPWITMGLITYTISCGIWLIVLSRVKLSVAYPISSLGYVTSMFAAYYLLNEEISSVRVIGILIILLGVYLVAKS